MNRRELAKVIHEADWEPTILDQMKGAPRQSWEAVENGSSMGAMQDRIEAYARADAVLALLAVSS